MRGGCASPSQLRAPNHPECTLKAHIDEVAGNSTLHIARLADCIDEDFAVVERTLQVRKKMMRGMGGNV
jgi:hypothetical protein